MDFNFSPAQRILQRNARKLFKNEAPLAHVREMEGNPTGYSPGLWGKIAGLGWLGLDYPREYGGAGGSLADVAVVAEEMGRALFPSPYVATAVLTGHSLLAAGNERQKIEILPGITSGTRIITIALTEPSGSYEPSGIEVTAMGQIGAGFRLNGVKLLVPYAHVADLMVVVARTGNRGPAGNGLSLLLVDPASPGVSITPVRIISLEKQSEVVFREAEVPQANLVGNLGGGWPVVMEVLSRGRVVMSAEMIGGSQAVLELAVEYARERRQFGKPIGQFQAIKHRLADVATEIEGARWLTYKAAWEVAERGAASPTASLAKAFAGDVYIRAARAAVQTYGGYGYMKECDVQLFFRRAKAAEAFLGHQHYCRELAAQQMGL